MIERPAADGYRSALGEWGHYRRDAIFELLNADAGSRAQAEADDNDTRDSAQLLTSGGAVEGSVQITEDIDWFRVAIAEGRTSSRSSSKVTRRSATATSSSTLPATRSGST